MGARERLRAAHDIGSSACFCRFLINSRSDSPPSSSHSPIYVLLWLFAILDKFLQSISLSIAISRLDPGVWRRSIHFGISRVKPTRRGTRGGRRRSCTPPSSTTFLHRTNNFCATPSLESTFCSPTVGNLPERRVLHIPPPSQLNIQLDTFPIGSINNQPVTDIGSQNRHRTSSTAPRGRNSSKISVINCRARREEHEFGMNILLANT